jgi:hypothetical protein
MLKPGESQVFPCAIFSIADFGLVPAADEMPLPIVISKVWYFLRGYFHPKCAVMVCEPFELRTF